MAAAAQDMMDEPSDTDAHAALRFQLKKLLAMDKQLVMALQQLVEDAGQSTSYHAEVHGGGVIGQGSRATVGEGIAVSGNVHGNVIYGQ